MMKSVRLHIIIYILLTVILMALPYNVVADEFSNDRMCYLTKERGLPGETVNQIITDAIGQVWIATDNGVCRYNGRDLHIFPFPNETKKAIFTYSITFDAHGTLYAATKKGIYQLNRGDNAFHRIYPSIEMAETALAVGETLFVGNRQGFNVLQDGKVRTITVGSTPTGIENGIRDIKLGEDGNVWFVSRYGLHRYNLKIGHVTSYDIAHLLPPRAALSRLLPVAGHFFIGTKNNGLYIYSTKTRQASRVKGIGNTIGALTAAPAGCITVSGGGAFLLNAHNGQIVKQFVQKDREGHGDLPTDAVNCYYRDHNGVDWFGLYRYGAAYFYHSENLFHIYKFGDFTSEGLDVRSVLVHGAQKVIGTANDLWFVDEQRHLVKHYSSEQLGDAHAISQLAYYNGAYYVGSFDAGLHRFSATNFDPLPNLPEPVLSTTTIGSLVTDNRGNLWMGTGEGLFILGANGQLRHYTENNSNIIGSLITAILFMPNGNAWLGGPSGLCLYNSKTGNFEKDHFPTNFFSTANIKEIIAAHQGDYIFNAGSNIYYSDAALHHFGEITPPQNISLNNCISTLDDFRGHYWLATEDGLFCSDYPGTNVLHFGYGEGLCCQLIAGRITMDSNHNIWVCTSNGLMHVRMEDLQRWQRQAKYKLLLYHVYIDGNPIELGTESDINDNHRLSMKWNLASSVLTLRPLLADYARPYGRLYEYKVDGEKEWRVVKDGEDIRLRHLGIGRHSLEVRLAGAPGTLTTYQISVSPSGWAILELLLFIVAVIAFVLWYRYRKSTYTLLQERNEIEEALIETETEKQQNELQQAEAPKVEVEKASAKYERVKVDEAECTNIVKRMKDYIEKNKIYTDPDLKMSDLADHLGISSSKLSQVFNLYLKENWYDFINRYRLAEFKRLIAEGKDKQYTLLALSAKCGFKKSSFFTTFRKVEGMTPTEYLKEHK